MFGAATTVTFDFVTLNGLTIDGSHYDATYNDNGTLKNGEHWQPMNNITCGGVVMTFSKGSSSTEPALYSDGTSGALRLYGGSSGNMLTVTAPAGKLITAMSLKNSSAPNDAAGTSYLASIGTLNASNGKAMAWSYAQGASSVTLTFNLNIRTSSLTLSLIDGTSIVDPDPDPDPNPDPDPDPDPDLDPDPNPTIVNSLNLPFTDGSDGGFTLGSSADAASFWKLDNKYGLVANGMVGSRYEANTRAVSPVIDLTNAETATINFDWTGNHFGSMSGMRQYVAVEVQEYGFSSWTALNVPNWPAGNNWTYVNSGNIDLSHWVGKKIRFCFHYTSGGTSSTDTGTLEIKNLKLTQTEKVIVPEPDPTYKVNLVVAEYVNGQLVPNPDAGTLILSNSKTEFLEGDYYYVTANPSDGYSFRYILDGNGNNVTSNTVSCRMGNQDVTVTAVFDRLYKITTSVWMDKKGELTQDTSDSSSIGSIYYYPENYTSERKGYIAGEVINIKVSNYSAINELEYVLVNGEKYEKSFFQVTMGNQDLDVRAVFRKIPVRYRLSINYSETEGTVALSPESEDGVYEEETEVTVTATPKDGYVFKYFTAQNSLTTGGRSLAPEPTVYLYEENPLKIVMDKNCDIRAVFSRPTYTVKSSTRTLDAEGNVMDYTIGSISPSLYNPNSFYKGDKIIFTATLGSSWDGKADFKYFLVDGEQHTENPLEYTVGDHNGEIIAVFQHRPKINIFTSSCCLNQDGSFGDELDANFSLSTAYPYAYPGNEISVSTLSYDSRLEFAYFLVNGQKYTDNPATITVGNEDFEIKAVYQYRKISGNLIIRKFYYRDSKNYREDASVGTYQITPEQEFYRYYDEVTVKGIPAENYEVKHMTVTDNNNNSKTITDSDEITFKFYYNYGNEYEVCIYFIPKVAKLNLNVLTLKADDSIKEDAVGGYILTDPEKSEYRIGDEVNIGVMYYKDYRFSHLIINGERFDTSSAKLTLGAVPFEITAVFKEVEFPLNIETYYNRKINTEVGKVIVEPLKDKYKVGDKITISAECDYGYELDRMEVNKREYYRWNFPLEYTVTDQGYDQLDIVAYFTDAQPITKMVYCIEELGNYRDYVDIRDACRIVFDDGRSRQELPNPNQGGQYAQYLNGTMVDVEIIPNEGYEYLYTRGVEGEMTKEKKFTTRWGYDFGESFAIVFASNLKNHVFTHSTGVRVNDYWGEPLVPGSITSSRKEGDALKPGDQLTFTATPESGFKFEWFDVSISYKGYSLSSYKSTDNPLTLTVGEKDYEIRVTAVFAIDMPKIFIGDSSNRMTFRGNDYGWISVSPEPAFMASDDCAYFPKGTEVTLTVNVRKEAEKYYYLREMLVDDSTTYMNPIYLTMDRDHNVTPNLEYARYDNHESWYTWYHQERGVIDFYEKIWNDYTPLYCFVDHTYIGSIAACDSININTHPAFKPGTVHFVRFRDVSNFINNALYVMTAPKVRYKPYVVNLSGVGSGQIDIYEVLIEADDDARVEYEVYDIKNGYSRWYTPEEYKSLFGLLGIDRVAVLPELLGYRLTGIRAYNTANGEQLTSSVVEVPSYDYIRTNLNELTAEDLRDVEVYDLNGHRVHSDVLAPGIYIIRQGSEVRKVIIR